MGLELLNVETENYSNDRVEEIAKTLGFVSLPPLYWGLLAIMLVCYVTLTQAVKVWFYKRFGE